MKIKSLLLFTAALTMGACSAHAQSMTSGPRPIPRPDIAAKNYTAENHREDRNDAKAYEEYERREPCQNYRDVPRNFNSGCQESYKIETAASTATEIPLLPVIKSYTVLFDFDNSTIRSNENETLQQVMQEVRRYEPRQVTVTGYADSSGATAYNQELSRMREQAVSRALLSQGVSNYTLTRDARGEYDQAVKTPDDTKNQQNRRVVIDLRR